MGQGLFRKNSSGMGVNGFNTIKMPQSKQWVLEPAQQGVSGNGIATITPDNTFSLVAHLPTPQALGVYGSYAYAAYLVDNKGNNGFLAGVLRPVGHGVYQVQFQSPVPLVHYRKVIVSMENPMRIGPVPAGPIVLKVRDPLGAVSFLAPFKTVGVGIWGKVKGLLQRASAVPEMGEGQLPDATTGEGVNALSQGAEQPPRGLEQPPHGIEHLPHGKTAGSSSPEAINSSVQAGVQQSLEPSGLAQPNEPPIQGQP